MAHVLVVDDQPDICAVLQMALEDYGGYRVSAATTVGKAFAFLDSDPPNLVVLDAVMPGLPGPHGLAAFELAVEAVGRRIPVVMMTGEPAVDETMDRLGWPHLRKPFHLQDLLAEARRTIAEAEANLLAVRASLQKLVKTGSDLRQTLETLYRSRRRVYGTLERSQRQHDEV